MKISTNWRHWLFRIVLGLWMLQIIWLAWYFAPEARDLAWRVADQRTGAAMRQEDPLYHWLLAVAPIIPPQSTYVFVDNYEAGKEIEARYHLAPRRHILLTPGTPPSFLFYTLHNDQASFLLVREGDKPWVSRKAVQESPAFHRLAVPGPGLVYRVDYRKLSGRFYD
ncbi:MAG: hypothetical protein PHU44_00450 [Syntrophales bacterium]|nr:hypothetical protein [Syntrophales bacterium]